LAGREDPKQIPTASDPIPKRAARAPHTLMSLRVGQPLAGWCREGTCAIVLGAMPTLLRRHVFLSIGQACPRKRRSGTRGWRQFLIDD
jgi:hypothetical protein